MTEGSAMSQCTRNRSWNGPKNIEGDPRRPLSWSGVRIPTTLFLMLGLLSNASFPCNGDGADGPLLVSSDLVLDAFETRVIGLNSAGSLQIAVADTTGYAIDDEVLIVTMQDPTTVLLPDNITGRYETHRIVSIAPGVLGLDSALVNAYDEVNGVRHQVLRVYNFSSVTVQAKLSCSPWDSEVGGILFFRCQGALIINSGGSIDASELGYRGGPGHRFGIGHQGESIAGGLAQTHLSLVGAGGGGNFAPGGWGGGGAGGGYGTAGEQTAYNFAGQPYGDTEMTRILLGSGGGGGGGHPGDHQGGAGGAGGGTIQIYAFSMTNDGTMRANGGNGIGWQPLAGGGGGGSGGGIKLLIETVNTLGTIQVNKGLGTNSHAGGGMDGGLGRIYVGTEPHWVDLGQALAGTGGVAPLLTSSGNLAGGTTVQLDLSQALPSSLSALVLGFGQADAPFKGGVMVPSPDVVVFLTTSGLGTAALGFTMPTGVPACSRFYLHWWVEDAGGPSGFSASNALEARTP